MGDSIQWLLKNIGFAGDHIWDKLISIYSQQNLIITEPAKISHTPDIKKLVGKYIVIPAVDFCKTRMDICYKQFFYSRNKECKHFMIEYKEDTQTCVKKYLPVIDPSGNQKWQVLAKIDHVLNWKNKSLLVKIVCFRIPGRITAILNSERVLFIGQDKLDLMLKELDSIAVMLQT